jgi:hypothetical protein
VDFYFILFFSWAFFCVVAKVAMIKVAKVGRFSQIWLQPKYKHHNSLFLATFLEPLIENM